jgi:hypothetical protein
MHNVSQPIRWMTVFAILLTCRSLPGKNAGPSPKGEIVLVKLATPIYPMLARQTRISGEVQVLAEVRRDSSIASYRVVYTFKLDQTNCFVVNGSVKDIQPTRVSLSQSGVSVLAVPFCVDHDPLGPAYQIPNRSRAAKCLYLWHRGRPRLIGIP